MLGGVFLAALGEFLAPEVVKMLDVPGEVYPKGKKLTGMRARSGRGRVIYDDRKKLPIGIGNFEKMRKEGFYYIDKRRLIKELLLNWGEVNLFTRPRRFGKSLNMSMLKSFFEPDSDKSIFEGLEIEKEAALCKEYMGRFPVVSVSLKEIHANSYDAAWL